MRLTVLLLVSLCVAVTATSLSESPQELFAQFMSKYQKSYATADEQQLRYNNFVATLERVRAQRAEHEKVTGESGESVYGITKFSDLTPAEFKRYYTGYKPSKNPRTAPVAVSMINAIPTKFDWRSKGVVSPVKNQGQCGSCWAFSATEEIESSWALTSGKLLELSPEQIVDCDTVDAGCDGGDTTTAYQYVEGAPGLETESDYPYTAGGGNAGNCNFDPSLAKVTVTNYTYATPPCSGSCNNQNENEMLTNLVANGPVSICVDAEPWETYIGGILSSGCPHDYNDLDHCVQLVGYDKTGSTPYYIIRNSWGTDWGESGYIYVAIGSNLCGVADEATLVGTAAV